MKKYLGWDELIPGALLFSFDGECENSANLKQEDRPYSNFNSYTANVGDWRVLKPILNKEFCIDCQFCWIYCPDTSIISRDKKMIGIDYNHCKGCGVCADVCPTNPKSLLMFQEQVAEQDAIASWPAKDESKVESKKDE
ncbi:MAG: 4Fe-4S binding protein [Campylobacterales bacterium]|nr:4Fe-4S binding protein [Campylobacterales bacterium]